MRTLQNNNCKNKYIKESGLYFIMPTHYESLNVSQDATGNRTLAYGTYWKFPNGSAPALTTTASATDALVYTVRSTTSITVQIVSNIG